MNVFILEQIANLFKTYKKIAYCGRIDDNLIKLVLDSTAFYIDLTKGQSSIFCDESASLGHKNYSAPFDLALQKYCIKAEILDCKIDGNNRILQLKCQKNMLYKMAEFTLQLEFTGKYTNAILLDSGGIILECLRKITNNSRIIKNGIALKPLPQQESTRIKRVDLPQDILAFLREKNRQNNALDLENAKNLAITNLNQKIKKLQKSTVNAKFF